MRVFLTNLGCKLNQAELERLARELQAAGHRVVGRLEEADLHVINSCTVTHQAAATSRKTARRGRRANPRLRTILTGCYATGEPEEAAALSGVDLVVPNADKDRLVERIHEAFPGEVPDGRGTGPVPVPYVPLAFGNTRGLVKIEDGCNMRCAYCIIPFTRGRQRSRPLADVVAEVRAMGAAGYREVVVTGVQISHYRDNGHRLVDLTRALVAETEVPRLRLTSIAPWAFDERLLELLAHPRLCRHVHLSLQSGSTATLRRMRRPYTADSFARLVGRIRAAVPGIAVTTDVIVGFPGEDEGEFDESLAFVRQVGFAKVHAFPYSARPGTEAATLPNQVPAEAKRRRMAAMTEAGRESERAFWRAHLGCRLEVLWEERRDGLWRGTTDNYVRVHATAPEELGNRIVPARLAALAADGVRGEIETQGALGA